MKAVIVIDMPSSCSECPLNSHTEYDFDVCWVTQGKGGCPLRPLPQKMDIEQVGSIWGEEQRLCAIGYNKCRDKIVGETE